MCQRVLEGALSENVCERTRSRLNGRVSQRVMVGALLEGVRESLRGIRGRVRWGLRG